MIFPNLPFVAACWIRAWRNPAGRKTGRFFLRYLLGETTITMISPPDDNDRHFSLLRFCREHPFAAFLTLFFIMMAGMCIGAVHQTGGDRELLGSLSNLAW